MALACGGVALVAAVALLQPFAAGNLFPGRSAVGHAAAPAAVAEKPPAQTPEASAAAGQPSKLTNGLAIATSVRSLAAVPEFRTERAHPVAVTVRAPPVPAAPAPVAASATSPPPPRPALPMETELIPIALPPAAGDQPSAAPPSGATGPAPPHG